MLVFNLFDVLMTDYFNYVWMITEYIKGNEFHMHENMCCMVWNIFSPSTSVDIISSNINNSTSIPMKQAMGGGRYSGDIHMLNAEERSF